MTEGWHCSICYRRGRSPWGEPSKPISRVLYPDAEATGMSRVAPNRDGGHLSSPPDSRGGYRVPTQGGTMFPSGSSSQPGDGPDTHSPPIRPCSRWGLTVATSPQTTGRSYRPISPLSASGGRYVSVPLSVPDSRNPVIGAWELPSTLPSGARTFLPPDKSGRRPPSLHGPLPIAL